MADPFTIAVSVGGLASLGIQLLQGLNKYAGSALDSKGRIKAISTDIGLTVQVVQALDTTIQDDANREMMNDDAEKLAKEAVVQCQEIFTKIQSTLPDIDPVGIRKRDFVTWPFIEPKLELLRGNLEKVKATLQLLMNVIIFAAMSKRHAEQVSLNQQRIQIQKLVEEKTNAEARLEKLEREHANALAANTLTPPSPLLSSASMQMSAVPEDPGPIINLAMVAPPLALDTPTRDLIQTTPEGTENAARTHRHSSTQQSPSPSVVHPQELHASLGASRPTTSSDNDPDSESEDIMITLHDDYTACLRKLKTLQMKLDMALKKLFIPTVGLPKANPEHGPDARSEMVKTIEESVRDTSDCLGQRILGPGAHRTVLVKGNSQCSSPSEASVMAEVFQVLRAPRPNRRTRARSVLDKSEDEGQAGSENVAGLSANFDDATFLERGEAATAKAAAKEAAAKAKAAREEELANAATAARQTVEKEATTAAAIAKAENEKAIAEARAAHEKSLAEAKAAKKAAEAERDASNRGDGDKAPIKFTDAVDRSFTFPWHMVNTWEGMTTLIKQAFVNIEYLGPHVANGNYHLLGPNDEIILPQVWSWVLQPGWDVKMQLLPLPESIVEKLNVVPGTSTPAITTIAERAENIPPRRSKKAGGDKASKEFVFAFANDDSSDDPIVEVFIHSDDSYGRSCHTKNKVRKQSSPFSEWMLGGIRPRARPRKHEHLSRSRGVRKTNKRSEMVDGVADDVLGSDDSQSQSSGWLTEYDEGSSGHEPLENISVKRFSGQTSPTDMTPQFISSPPILPQRRSSDSGLCLEQGSLAVLDEPDSTSTGGSSEVIDNDASKRFESIENIIPPSTADISGSLLRNWFVPKDGINRQVISANIQRYLGNDATVRPGQDRVDGSEVQGYWIKAYRSLTTEMINDLQKASTIWDEEQRTGRRGAYEDSHAYRQATNAVSDDNEIYRASTSSPQLDSVYPPPGGCVPHHVAQRVAVPDMASTLYEDPRTRIYSLPLHSGAFVSTASGDPSIYASTLPVPMPRYDQYGRPYSPPTPIPDQSYTRPAPSVDSSYGRERQSVSPNVDRNALRRKVDATFAKRSGRDESHPRPRLSPPRTIIDPELDNDTATNTSGLVTVEDLLRRWTHLNPDSVDSAADLGN